MILPQAEYSILRRMVVCGPCGDVVGPACHSRQANGIVVQGGTCPTHPHESRTTWEGFDFNRLIELCRCCAATPLRSGSRWSVWFCPECKEQVGLLNGRLGRYAVPIGRHSLHGGWVLKPEQVDDPVAVHIFTKSFNSMGRAMDLLAEWAKVAVRLNLSAAGWSPDRTVAAQRYCRAMQEQVDPLTRFSEMCQYLGERSREGSSSNTRRDDDDTATGGAR